jgi:hypothetical protein
VIAAVGGAKLPVIGLVPQSRQSLGRFAEAPPAESAIAPIQAAGEGPRMHNEQDKKVWNASRWPRLDANSAS